MEIEEIKALAPDFDALRTKVMMVKTSSAKAADYLKQLEPEMHDIADTTKRPDKLITTDAGPSTIPVARLTVPLQKLIVNMAAAFLCGNPIKLEATEADSIQKDMLAAIQKTWSSNKLDYDSKRLAKILMSETEVAEIWYADEAGPTYWNGTVNEGSKFRLRMKVLANSLGDTLFPVFNKFNDLIAFGRSYSILIDGKNELHFDLYTDEMNWFATSRGGAWEAKEEKNWFGKIPVIYYSQPKPEWSDVQSLIDRFERILSNHGDTNDYFASPMVKVKGDIEGFAKKGDSGKILQLKEGADAEYMSWDQSPKSLELEFKNLRSLIFDMTSTPDISIEQLKSLGTYSGIALKMLFLTPHLKAADKEENFGKGIQRRINLIKDAMAKVNIKLEKATSLDVTPRFEYFLPKNDAEIVDMLVSATGGKQIMSTETAVGRNPMVENGVQELERLKEESAGATVNTLP